MGQLQTRVEAQLVDLNATRRREIALHNARLAQIDRSIATLESTLPLLTDDLEGAVEALQKLGLLREI
jgi:hypothetical protein